jgi:hypothetical protein
MGTIPMLIDPPWGRLKKLWLMRLNAPAKATNTIISANTLVEKAFFLFWVASFDLFELPNLLTAFPSASIIWVRFYGSTAV